MVEAFSVERTQLENRSGPDIWSLEDLAPEGCPEWVTSSHHAVSPYIREFLTAPHPHRSGAMCPYVPGALRSGSIFLSAGAVDGSTGELMNTARSAIERFRELRDPDNSSALIILFPENHSIQDLLHIHRDLKVWCVERHLMVGVLSPESEAWSLHSRDFFPLRTPVPTLVVRDMALFDTQFLVDGPYSVRHRLSFLDAYLERFGDSRLRDRAEVRNAWEQRRRYIRIRRALRAGLGASLSMLLWTAWRYRTTRENPPHDPR